MSETTERPEFLTTREVAELLRVRERKVYDLAAAGEIPCRRLTGKLLFPTDEIDSWLRGEATTGPAGTKSESVAGNIVAGSHDPLLEWAIRESRCGLATAFDGSLDGIERMKAGGVSAAGIHVIDPPTGAWNIPLVRDGLSSVSVTLVAWAARKRGLIVSREKAGQIFGLGDLAGNRLVRRQESAGATILLDHLIKSSGIDAATFDDNGEIAHTETEAAIAVSSGKADAALGLRAVATEFGLPFVPLVEERYDLIVQRHAWFEAPMQALLAFCRTQAFEAKAAALSGYDVSTLGTVRWNSPAA